MAVLVSSSCLARLREVIAGSRMRLLSSPFTINTCCLHTLPLKDSCRLHCPLTSMGCFVGPQSTLSGALPYPVEVLSRLSLLWPTSAMVFPHRVHGLPRERCPWSGLMLLRELYTESFPLLHSFECLLLLMCGLALPYLGLCRFEGELGISLLPLRQCVVLYTDYKAITDHFTLECAVFTHCCESVESHYKILSCFAGLLHASFEPGVFENDVVTDFKIVVEQLQHTDVLLPVFLCCID